MQKYEIQRKTPSTNWHHLGKMTGFTELSKKEALEDLQLITANYNGTKKVDENDLTAYAHDLNEDGNDGDRIDYRATIMEIN